MELLESMSLEMLNLSKKRKFYIVYRDLNHQYSGDYSWGGVSKKEAINAIQDGHSVVCSLREAMYLSNM